MRVYYMFIFFCEFVRDLSPRPTRLGSVGCVVGGTAIFGQKERFADACICAYIYIYVLYIRYTHKRPHTRPSAKRVKRDRENWFLSVNNTAVSVFVGIALFFFSAPTLPLPQPTQTCFKS